MKVWTAERALDSFNSTLHTLTMGMMSGSWPKESARHRPHHSAHYLEEDIKNLNKNDWISSDALIVFGAFVLLDTLLCPSLKCLAVFHGKLCNAPA